MNHEAPPPTIALDIETGHFYIDEFRDEKAAYEAFSAAHRYGVAVAQGSRALFSTMIDDYNEISDLTRERIIETLASWNPRPDYVVFESDLAGFAPTLIEAIRPAVLGTDGEDLYLYTTSNSLLLWGGPVAPRVDYLTMFARKYSLPAVPGAEPASEADSRATPESEHADAATRTLLRTGSGADAVYSCSLLIACWNLARLGVEPFCQVKRYTLDQSTEGAAEHVWSVLPSRFLKVEANAREIIDLCQSKRLNKKVRRISHIFV